MSAKAGGGTSFCIQLEEIASKIYADVTLVSSALDRFNLPMHCQAILQSFLSYLFTGQTYKESLSLKPYSITIRVTDLLTHENRNMQDGSQLEPSIHYTWQLLEIQCLLL